MSRQTIAAALTGYPGLSRLLTGVSGLSDPPHMTASRTVRTQKHNRCRYGDIVADLARTNYQRARIHVNLIIPRLWGHPRSKGLLLPLAGGTNGTAKSKQ